VILNPARLFETVPPGTQQAHSLRVLEHFLLKPLGEVWDVTITSSGMSIWWRRQATPRFSASTPAVSGNGTTRAS